ncbi:hypothetical protein WMY93_019562 [Mugilogobius chulae]|uniref:Uncharacterized protein n=1 Tax=Mugilogobius chulae TaxID=88201 RepID=A0AAW0NIR6_9GOBI
MFAMWCQQKTPITIRERHSLRNGLYVYHSDKPKGTRLVRSEGPLWRAETARSNKHRKHSQPKAKAHTPTQWEIWESKHKEEK